ncbi:hypothetical protein [Polymorphum gilvum]|uniref:Putative transmembrane anchored protein n=1 Tax=Polymorphum gilvum (strain LMG 25793 / CGMCC 1.9160 / SL003B-26A1) TaxID=991905 RepID=F2J517_POLGS|nr:hypothetical protein [Polymorphum gilvum]ADZ70059.1 Putative transmembrane anchored protein [Polymorphum gilvum SL003B-26A1]
MIPIAPPGPTGIRPLHFTALTVLLALLAAAYVAKMVGGWFAGTERLLTRTEEVAPVSLSIGRHAFAIPANMLRRPDQRIPGLRHDLVYLELIWPSLSGFTRDMAYAFGDTGAESRTIALEIAVARQAEGMSERLDTVYRRLARGGEAPGPAGLTMLDLAGEGEAGTDYVVFEAGRDGGFVARCQVPRDAAAPAFCSREVRLGRDLLLTYRFKRAALHNWGRLDRRILDLVHSLRAS